MGTLSYFYAEDEMIEILDPENNNLVELAPNSSQSVELEKMGMYVALRVDKNNELAELKLINSSGKEIEGRDAAWYDFPRTGVDGTIYETVKVYENPEKEQYILYNQGNTTLWLIDETSNQIEMFSNPSFIALTCGFCFGIPLAIIGLLILIIGWRRKKNIRLKTISNEFYIDKENENIKIITDTKKIPDPFIKTDLEVSQKVKISDSKDDFWEDWDNQ
tara:strand:- start:38308 stop:38964 length:657 start_codon:yes stop_codon:yes gene_type:complete